MSQNHIKLILVLTLLFLKSLFTLEFHKMYTDRLAKRDNKNRIMKLTNSNNKC